VVTRTYQRVHYFMPPGPEVAAFLDESPLRWARCSDAPWELERAAIVFHPQSAPLDVAGSAFKCLTCGERNDEGAPS
jgi:hypothetical protein